MLARKKIQCNWRLKPEDAIEEVAQLQPLRHAHVVRAVGTYIVGKELSILLYPTTEYTMESFLDEYAELNTAFTQMVHERTQSFRMRPDIFKFFRCLQSIIHFVHESLVKHMDIKPTNLLVQMERNVYAVEDKFYLADFGNACSYRAAAEVETNSPTILGFKKGGVYKCTVFISFDCFWFSRMHKSSNRRRSIHPCSLALYF